MTKSIEEIQRERIETLINLCANYEAVLALKDMQIADLKQQLHGKPWPKFDPQEDSYGG